jgi:amidase
MSALDQARLIRQRKLSSSELVRLYLGRIARHDPALGSFVQLLEESALATARKLDAAPMEGRAPFHGVPTGIKDLNFARGTFTRMGAKSFRYFFSPFDDVTTAAVRRAGFVIVGKLSTSELGAMPVTEPSTHHPTRNPWDRGRTSGGSSGGSATAVAAGLLPIAQASDGAGSIRIPASLCGLVGHKASRNTIPNGLGRIDPVRMITMGPVGRSVDDVAAMLDVLVNGKHEGSFLSGAQREPAGLNVRFTTSSPLGKCTAEIVATTLDVVKRLEKLGHHVEEGGPPEGDIDEVLPIWQRQLARIPLVRDASLQPATKWLRETGRHVREDDVLRRASGLSRRVFQWFGDADLWVTPTLPVAPPKVGQWSGLSGEEQFRSAAVMGAFTALFNLTGQPAVSIPAGVSSEGHPIGVQIIGRMGADGLVLAVAKQLEAELGWTSRHVMGSYV